MKDLIKDLKVVMVSGLDIDFKDKTMEKLITSYISEKKAFSLRVVMPCFEFSNKATKYTENGVTTLAVDTDGIALTNDNLPHQAYTLEEGVKYTVKLYKA